jgi:hypothetical protein
VNLKPTRVEESFTVGDASGYRFDVVACLDPEWGWSASVTIASHGFKTSEAAVEALRNGAEHFVRLLNETKGTQ